MKSVLKFAGILLGVMGVIAFVLFGSSAYLRTRSSSIMGVTSHENECEKKPTAVNHLIVIEKNIVSPEVTVGNRCDTITILNKDNIQREIAFGEHDQHITYLETDKTPLGVSGSLTFTLHEVGQFRIHDHKDDSVSGVFIVKDN